jgi:DNA-binding transcriptional regulator LsrR (DeoR family)
MTDQDAKALIKEMRDVKMLLILQMLDAGVRQRQIATALGISEATMSRMLPKGLASKPGKAANGAAS